MEGDSTPSVLHCEHALFVSASQEFVFCLDLVVLSCWLPVYLLIAPPQRCLRKRRFALPSWGWFMGM